MFLFLHECIVVVLQYSYSKNRNYFMLGLNMQIQLLFYFKRNQCHTGVCSDAADCYKSITAAGKCTSDQKYCQVLPTIS